MDTDEERHVAPGLGKPAAKVAADRTSADDKNPHSHVKVSLFSGKWGMFLQKLNRSAMPLSTKSIPTSKGSRCHSGLLCRGRATLKAGNRKVLIFRVYL